MQEAQLSSVTRGETRIKPKSWWGERCEEERLLGVPCLSISSIAALILCSVIFTRGLAGELGALLGCRHWHEHPWREREDTDSCPKIPARLLHVHANDSQEGVLASCLPRGSWKGWGARGGG